MQGVNFVGSQYISDSRLDRISCGRYFKKKRLLAHSSSTFMVPDLRFIVEIIKLSSMSSHRASILLNLDSKKKWLAI